MAASGITGFTFPGIILLPGCKDFSVMSEIPEPGPEFIHLKSLDIFKISLDNPESFNLRKEISWIRKEVEILPLIGVINRGHLVRKFQGSEVKKALIFLHSLRSLNSEQI